MPTNILIVLDAKHDFLSNQTTEKQSGSKDLISLLFKLLSNRYTLQVLYGKITRAISMVATNFIIFIFILPVFFIYDIEYVIPTPEIFVNLIKRSVQTKLVE